MLVFLVVNVSGVGAIESNANRSVSRGDGKVQNEFGGKDIVERARIADWLAFAGAWMEVRFALPLSKPRDEHEWLMTV